MKRIALALLLAATPAAAQRAEDTRGADPLADAPMLTFMALQHLEAGGTLGDDIFVARTLELFDPADLTPDWTESSSGYGDAAEVRILRVTPYPSNGANPPLSAVDYAVFYEGGGFLCGYAIWEEAEVGPAMRRFQFGVADPDVMRSREPERSEALRELGCTVFPNDMPGGPLR